MATESDSNADEIAELAEINQKPLFQRLGYYAKKSGPGWLQGAITLGGGSLGGSLFLGVILGYSLMWLQPFAMVLGVIMLSAIAYVTLSTGKRPFGAINEHVSPVLGWAWLIGAMMANIVWTLPQYALGIGAIEQNILEMDKSGGGMLVKASPWIISIILLVGASVAVRFYDRDTKGVKVFETILKVMVGIIVVSFFVVVGKLTAAGQLEWGKIFAGFIPNFKYLNSPSPIIAEAIAATSSASGEVWSGIVQGVQKDKIIAAFGTAVGINMTFLLPYSMLRKKWGVEHRQLALVDLAVGLIVPFVLATGCILIASGSQFHGKYADILAEDGKVLAGMDGGFNKVADGFLGKSVDGFGDLGKELKAAKKAKDETKIADLSGKIQAYRDNMSLEDRRISAMLVDRNDKQLANTLEKLGNATVSRKIFGIGVLGMAVSTIIILMLINGFCLCEAMGKPGDRNLHFIGCLIPGIFGLMSPIIWAGDAKAALAVPTSVIGSSFLPIAYFTFLLLMNSKSLLGNAMPKGNKRIVLNLVMGFATAVVTFGSIWAIKDKVLFGFPMGKVGIAALVILFVLGTFGFITKNRKKAGV